MILVVVVGWLVVLELGLRLLFGFGNPLLYIPDAQCGYLLAPNQRRRRFGNRIEINQYSMRSPAIAPLPHASVMRVLLLGDSVANGGWWTDQAETISAQIARLLSAKLGGTGVAVEVLNASANSWGPRNELAYLQKFGRFGAEGVVLLLNTDDLFARVPSGWVVGRDRHYPNRKPICAIAEVLLRYLSPPPLLPDSLQTDETGDRVGLNLEAIRQIAQIAVQGNCYFLLALTPLLREVSDRGPRDYEIRARTRLAELVETESINYLDFLLLFQGCDRPATLYRDNIHLSPQGNLMVSQALSQKIGKIR